MMFGTKFAMTPLLLASRRLVVGAFLSPLSSSTGSTTRRVAFATLSGGKTRLFAEVSSSSSESISSKSEPVTGRGDDSDNNMLGAPILGVTPGDDDTTDVLSTTPVSTTGELPPDVPMDKEHTAYVVNLPYDVSEISLRSVFEKHGTVVKLFIPTSRTTGRARGFAFVTMSNESELNKVISELNETTLEDRTIYVSQALPKGEQPTTRRPVAEEQSGTKIYVGNIPFETTEQDLIQHFAQYGDVRDIYIPLDINSGSPRGFAFVNMDNDKASKAIDQLDGSELLGRTITVSKSLPRGQKKPNSPGGYKTKNETKLYVGNLSFETELDTLRNMFEEYGPVLDLYMPSDRYTGRCRGFAFVAMQPDDARRVIDELDGVEVDGRTVRINEAKPKQRSPSGGSYDSNAPEYDDSW